MGAILGIFDVTGIQNFIFNSNRLKENVGGSAIVKKTLTEYLKAVLIKVANKNDGVKLETHWENRIEEEFDFKKNSKDENYKAIEVIYIGGGNAFVAFTDESLYKQTVKLFSIELLENTYSLNVASTYIYMGEIFSDDYKELNKKLAQKKNSMFRQRPMGNLPITNHDLKTGLPITNNIESVTNSYVSREKFLKLKKDIDAENLYVKPIKKSNTKKVEENDSMEKINEICKDFNPYFPEEFDHIAGEKGEDSFIGVVHIDGNSMGKTIEELTKGITDYGKAIGTMRKISQEIDFIYSEAFKDLVKVLEGKSNNKKVKVYHTINKKERFYAKKFFVIRPLINEGDDVTFVIQGKYAIFAARFFLEKISEEKLLGEKELSACAGIAIVNSHYPFYESYNLAEKCCANAKKLAREAKGNYMDIEICHAGIITSLEELRRFYREEVKPLSMNETDKNSFKNFQEIVNGFKNWPHSSLKELYASFFKGKQDIKQVVSRASSRGYKLPLYKFDEKEIKEIDTDYPYLRALELMDKYEEV